MRLRGYATARNAASQRSTTRVPSPTFGARVSVPYHMSDALAASDGRAVYLATRPTWARGLAAGAGLLLSSLSRPFTSSMNWAMSLNWRYTDAKRT